MEAMLFRIKQFGLRLFRLGIRGDIIERRYFWRHLYSRLFRKYAEAPVYEEIKEWEFRNRIQDKLDQVSEFPLISVIILTYNNFLLNEQCLKSVKENTLYPNYEIIIVDNASQDGTQQWLMKQENLKVICNESNLGFAAANNIGIQNAAGEYVVLLNNDTYVMPGWLSVLFFHMQKERGLGMCGPVTDSIGNEAKIKMPSNMEAFDQRKVYALSYIDHFWGASTKPINVLAFFCVLIRREVIERCGLLDEAYGLGMFEDDDYAESVKRAGYYIGLAEDAFVFHFESSSFSKIKSRQFREIYTKNRKYFEKKWKKKWQPHIMRE